MSDGDNDNELNADDRDTIEHLESALEEGESLKAWWLDAEAHEDWSERFELCRATQASSRCGAFSPTPR